MRTLTTEQREELVNRLVDNVLDSIANSKDYVKVIIRDGFKGLTCYTNEELLQQYAEIFDEDFLEKSQA